MMKKPKYLLTELDVLHEIENAAEELGLAPSTLCMNAVKNGALPKRLRSGGTVTLETIARIREHIEAMKREYRIT